MFNISNFPTLFSLIILNFLFTHAISQQLPKIQLQSVRNKGKAQLKQIQPQLSHVLVETQFVLSSEAAHKYEKVYLSIHGTHRNKKTAFNKLKEKYEKITKKLTREKIIPNPESLIHSIVHQRYLKNKKQWRFTRYFVIVYPSQNEEKGQECQQMILRKIAKFHPNKISPKGQINKKVINYLDEKEIALHAFLEAKLELQNFIKENFQGNYIIVTTKDLQLSTKAIANHEALEDDIEDSYAQRMKQELTSISDQDSVMVAGYDGLSSADKAQKNVKIKVLFQIADKSFDIEEYFEEMEKIPEEEEESVSDYESGEDEDFEQL